MKPLNENIEVELVQDEGVLQMMPDQYAVVKVLAVPPLEPSNVNAPYVTVGGKVLTTHVRDFLVDNNKKYFTNLKDIVEVL